MTGNATDISAVVAQRMLKGWVRRVLRFAPLDAEIPDRTQDLDRCSLR